MNGVNVRNNENIERALRRFKRVCDNAGVIPEMKKKRRFEKPSMVKRLKLKAAIRKAQKDKSREDNNKY
jgi:small subunit ribosomal protein S21